MGYVFALEKRIPAELRATTPSVFETTHIPLTNMTGKRFATDIRTHKGNTAISRHQHQLLLPQERKQLRDNGKQIRQQSAI